MYKGYQTLCDQMTFDDQMGLVQPQRPPLGEALQKNPVEKLRQLMAANRYKWCMVLTITHAVKEFRYTPNDKLIEGFEKRLHSYTKHRGLRYYFVYEYTKAGVPHYHGIIYCPEKSCAKYPTVENWCKRTFGNTKIEPIACLHLAYSTGKRTTSFEAIMKYITKEDMSLYRSMYYL